MKILLGCDVDPVLPPLLENRPGTDVWRCLGNIDQLVRAMGEDLPPVTWLIRSDESVRFSTDSFASGYTTREALWQSLVARGHELGWHLHLTSYDPRRRCFEFDPDPAWLGEARDALAAHYDVRATRTGWDYGSNVLFQRLDALGVAIDFSALPGNIVWHWAGHDKMTIDWSRCPATPYHPSPDDHQRPGTLKLLEVPITQFENSLVGVTKRLGWRLRNGCYALSGLRRKTRMLTEAWSSLPRARGPVWAFYFHPEDLQGRGLANFRQNVEGLRMVRDAEFVTASGAYDYLQ
jgi:hypothetical protein